MFVVALIPVFFGIANPCNLPLTDKYAVVAAVPSQLTAWHL